jgi:UDP-N-acetylglucosamine 3-dehydrogenase
MMKVGVIGVGSMGQNHARLYSELPCEFVGVSDTNPDQGKAVADKYRTAYFADYHDLIGKVDAVSIVVPTVYHHQVAVEFLKAGVHCLVEKPISSDIGRADEMIAAASASGVKLAVGHIENFNPAVRKLKDLINEGALGDLIMLTARRVGPFVPRIRDVGIIVDSATHDIGVMNYLAGCTPSDITAKVGALQHEISDHALIMLDYYGLFGSIEFCLGVAQNDLQLVATGSEGIAYLDYIKQTITLYNHETAVDIEVQKDEPLKLEVQDFLASVANNHQPHVDGLRARDILDVASRAKNGHVYGPLGRKINEFLHSGVS